MFQRKAAAQGHQDQNSRRILVQNGSYQELADLGNQDTTDPNTLADFISWGVRTYPSAHTALILWDHGGSWQGGFGEDDGSGGVTMSVAKIKTGIASGLASAGLARLDLLGFDACLMSTFEVLESLKPYTRYYLASEETEPGKGWDYRKLQAAKTTPAIDAVAFGKLWVDGFVEQNPVPSVTLALFDAQGLGDLEAAIDAFSTQNAARISSVALNFARSRAGVVEFGANPNPANAMNMIDLGDLSARLASSAPDLFGASNVAIKAALAKAVVYQRTGSAAVAAAGLSLYFPPSSDTYQAAGYRAVPGIANWRTFLEAYLAEGAAVATPTFSGVAAVTPSASGLSIAAPLTSGASASIGSVKLRYGYSFPASAAGANDDEVDFYGDRPGAFDAAQATASWNRELMRLAQGATHSFSYFGLSERGPNLASVEVPLAYLPPGVGTCGGTGVLVASRQLIIDTASGAVQEDVVYATGASGSVSELKPQAGSHFVPIVFFLVGTHKLTQAPSSSGWGCLATQFAADQAIALNFVTPSLGAGVEVALLLSIANPAGHGDSAAAVGSY